ncbi:MAG: hypothetical protein ACREUO_07610 [Burkholderiales bacterium]
MDLTNKVFAPAAAAEAYLGLLAARGIERQALVNLRLEASDVKTS